MKAEIIGTVKERLNGEIDLQNWVFDCDCCSHINEAANKHRDELIRLAKGNGTYSYDSRALSSGGSLDVPAF
jgi:hypothetical protein